MSATRNKLSIVLLALTTAIALASPSVSYAQHGGGHGGGGHGGGGGRSGSHSGGGRQTSSHNGGNRGGSGPSWNGSGNRGGYNYGGGNRGNQNYAGSNRGYNRSGYSNLNQFYGGQYNSGYRGNNFGYGGYGYGRSGFGPGYGNYGYGYFPWYIGLATYGAGIGRGYGYGGNSGYATQSAPVIVERSVQSSMQANSSPQNDYVPQMNRTTTVLGAQSSGAAVLGVTMDPQYPSAAVVRQVTPGSAAEKAGLRPGDMFTAIDKAEIRNPADVTNLVGTKQAGDQLDIAFIRPVLRSEVREAAPEQGLGITAPAKPEPAEAGELAEPVAPPVPTAPSPSGN